jgi:alpha-D-ribose 1-methylphosphonate 5-triphosphate synthase subunit PhnH
VALTLLDADTPVWLDEQLSAAKPVRDWIAFHCGAPVTSILAEAHFALVSQPSAMPSLESFSQGSQSYPDRSATLVLQVDGFDGEDMLLLEGPGIETRARFLPAPLPRHFAGQWRQNNGRFPRGIDLVFAAPGAIAAMPRTARIVEGGA